MKTNKTQPRLQVGREQAWDKPETPVLGVPIQEMQMKPAHELSEYQGDKEVHISQGDLSSLEQ